MYHEIVTFVLGLLGGNLLGVQNPGLLGLGGLGQIGQPNLLAPQTSFITHTRYKIKSKPMQSVQLPNDGQMSE